MYKDGVGSEVSVLDTKYTDYVRRQELERMAAAGVAPYKKVNNSDSKQKSLSKDKDKAKDMAAAAAIKAKGESNNPGTKLVRTRSVDAVNGEADGNARKSRGNGNRSSSSTSSRGDSAGTENYRPPTTPDYGSLIKFSQMFNSKESYALQQYEVFKAAHRANYPESKSVENGYSDESDDEGEDDEEDATPPLPPSEAKGKDGKPGKDKGKEKEKEKEKEKGKKLFGKDKAKKKEEEKGKSKKLEQAPPEEKSGPLKPVLAPPPAPPNNTTQTWRNKDHHHITTEEDDDEDDEGRTIATTSTNNTEASTLADEVNSDILRQELLQNIRAISSTFPDNDMSFNAAVDVLTDTYRHRLSILGFENGRRDSQPEHAQAQEHERALVSGGHDAEPSLHGARERGRPTPPSTFPEPLRTGPSDDPEEFLLKSKTPSGKSKTKSIDNWIANSNREINNNLNRLGAPEVDVEDVEANLNEHHVKSAGLLGLGKVPPAMLVNKDANPTQPPKYVNVTGGTKYQQVKQALEENMRHKSDEEGSSPRPPPFSTCDDDSDRELRLTLPHSRAEAINLHAQASSLTSYGLGGSFSSSPVPPVSHVPVAAAPALHDADGSTGGSNVRSIFNRRPPSKAKPMKAKAKLFGNQRLRSSRGHAPAATAAGASMSIDSINDIDNENEPASADDHQVRYNFLPSIAPSTPPLIRKRKQQLLEASTRVPGMLRRQNMDQWIAKVVWFYKNGDEFGNRHEFRFRPLKDVHDFEGLCDILTQRIGLPRGVRHIFTIDGQPIWSLSQLKHEHSYVVSSTRKFKFMDYGKPSADSLRSNGVLDLSSPFENHSSAPLRETTREASTLRRERSLNDVRNERERQRQYDQMQLYNGHNNLRNLSMKSDPSKSIQLLSTTATPKQQNNAMLERERKSPTPEVERLVNQAILQSSQYRAQLRPIERQIILVINGVNPKIHSQVLLNTRVSQEWEELVKDLGMAVKIPKHYEGVLKTASGKSVMSYSQLRSELRNGNQTYYVFPLKRRFPPQRSRGQGQSVAHRDETLKNMKNLSLSDSVVKMNNSAIFENTSTRYTDMRLPSTGGDGYYNNLTERK